MAYNVCIGGAQTRLRGGTLEIGISKAFEEGANRPNIRHRVGVEHDDTVEVSCHLFQALDHLIDNLH